MKKKGKKIEIERRKEVMQAIVKMWEPKNFAVHLRYVFSN